MRKIKTGDRCPCCGGVVLTRDPLDLAQLGRLAELMHAPERTCGTCRVAIDVGIPLAVACPFKRRPDGSPWLRSADSPCCMEVVE